MCGTGVCEEEQMKDTEPNVTVIGAGFWGKNLVRNFYSLGALHTLCESNQDLLQSYSHQYPDLRFVSSLPEVMENPEIKAVAIATPAATHATIVREALLAGKDVYVEKPLCFSEEEGRELSELAQREKRILMVGHLLWYHPVVLELKRLIQEGELGRIQYIYSNRLNLGKLRREENVLWSFAPHDISVILGLLEEMPDSVKAQGGNYLHQRIADTTISLLTFPSGVRAHIFVSWLHPFKEQKLVVVGDMKMAVFDDTASWNGKLKLYPHRVDWHGIIPVANKADAEIIEVTEEEPLKVECQHFLECIENRSRPRTDDKEGLRVLKVLNACQRALESPTPILLGANDDRDYFAHETAILDPSVEIGQGSKIWHFSHILGGSRLGKSCNVGQNVVIGPDVDIGNGCKIQNNVSVYKGVTLEENVFCGPSMVFTNVINPRSHIERKSKYKPTLVKRGATIGANATIVCGHTLGRYCFIGAGAVVISDVADHALVVGNPARQVGWICACGERLPNELECPACSTAYKHTSNGLEPIE